MTRKYIALDIEAVKPFPDGSDWRDHRPLGIGCIAAYSGDPVASHTWHGRSAENIDGIALAMTQDELRDVVASLRAMTNQHGLTILTWNGLGFDFDVLAEESGLEDQCKDLALAHVDMMFAFFSQKGYPLALNTAAIGMDTPRKTEGMDGAKAMSMWAQGDRQRVVDYCLQDTRSTYELALACEREHRLDWTSKTGKSQTLFLPCQWMTVAQALQTPEPNNSWMKDPRSRTSFAGWLQR